MRHNIGLGFTGLLGLACLPIAETVCAQSSTLPLSTSSGSLLRQNQSLLTLGVTGKPVDDDDFGENATWPIWQPRQSARRYELPTRLASGEPSILYVRLRNSSLVSDETLEHYLPTATRISESSALSDIEPDLRRINALPGVAQVQPAFSPGKTEGTTDVIFQAKPDPRISGAVFADNAGSATSGRNRIGAQLTVNSPFGLGD